MGRVRQKTSVAPEEIPQARSVRFERQRGRIIDAATVLLNQKGVDGTTFQDVAQQLGLKTTAVTYYFRYKEQLVVAVFSDSLERLGRMVEESARADTPRTRVDRFLKLYLDHYAAASRGEARPLAILSEIRTLEKSARLDLVESYVNIFRGVRAFFGQSDTPAQKQTLTARAQMLIEAMHWAGVIWLQQYDVADFDNIRRQMLQIFDGGIGSPGTGWESNIIFLPDTSLRSDNVDAFLRTATRSLNVVGHKGTSIERVAAELNVTKGSFYHHLDTKDQLILECFHSSYRRQWDISEKLIAAGLAKWQMLVSIIANAIRIQFDGNYPLLSATAFQSLPASLRSIPVEYSQRTALFLTGLVVDAHQEGSARYVNPLLASHIVMSTINSAFDIRDWASKQNLDDAVRNYVKLITEGLFDPE